MITYHPHKPYIYNTERYRKEFNTEQEMKKYITEHHSLHLSSNIVLSNNAVVVYTPYMENHIKKYHMLFMGEYTESK